MELFVISDLHLADGSPPAPGARAGGEPFEADSELERFLDHVAELRPDRLLVLGDLFDFQRVDLGRGRAGRLATSTEAAVEKLDRISAAHERVFAALGRLAAGPVRLELVAGNHDAELMRPRVRGRLAELLARAAGRPVAARDVVFRPWIVHLPGLLYAEHGQQHHEISRFPELLRAYGDPSAPLELPVGSHLEQIGFERSTAGRLGAAASTAGVLARQPQPVTVARRRRAPGHSFDETGLVEQTRLEPDTLAALEAVSARRPVAALARTARRVVAGRRSEPYMLEAARKVDAVLRRDGCAVPFYVFAHTHELADSPLDRERRGPARYLNPGSWSLSRTARPAPRSYLRISGEPAPRATLLRWEGPPRR